MSHLTSFTIIEAPKQKSFTPIEQKRKKLLAKLDEQIAVHEAEKTGETYQRNRSVWVTDEDGTKRKVNKPVYPKPWWWKSDEGKTLLQVKYGTKPLMLAKDKTAIELQDKSKLAQTLVSVRNALIDGELDAAIELVAQRPNTDKKQATKKS